MADPPISGAVQAQAIPIWQNRFAAAFQAGKTVPIKSKRNNAAAEINQTPIGSRTNGLPAACR
ncbi:MULTISPECIES: hypothetical protein [Neisseria]|uniref:hypothetical protein n=1 Tax=Neisseria TaxID=482 RepID=UPI0010726418|nr:MULTISPECIES: hypothetical protein [Neisseria]MBF0804462.1 hypothetical protein [Neisseria sp. 19428wB4_WF04]TFU40528.1 hypothetical protein E4T99_08920 [Neisseria sp. WF04]TFV06937.1 hypothetical protein E4T85_19670 [Bacillus stratosphericus]